MPKLSILFTSIVFFLNFSPSLPSILCAVSESLSPLTSGNNNYPIDVYYAELLNNLSSTKKEDVYNYKCFAKEFVKVADASDYSKADYDKVLHKCSTGSLKCPIKMDQVEAGTRRMSNWMSHPYLCTFHDAWRSSQKIHTIVIGNEITLGDFTSGSICDSDADPILKNTNIFSSCLNEKEINQKETVYDRNGWYKYLTRWMETNQKPDFEFINLAKGGTTSFHSGHMNSNATFKVQFSENDIIFIDQSITDVQYIGGDWKREWTIQIGLESLIRNIYEASSIGHLPTVVILEFWPYPSRIHLPLDKHYEEKVDYAHIYEKVAQHYNIPIWSYRDAVWSLKGNESQSFVEYIRFNRNSMSHLNAPPWHVHLYYADLISAIILHEFNKCNALSEEELRKGKKLLKEKTLPTRMIKHEQGKYCDEQLVPFLDISAKHRDGISTEFTIKPPNSWVLHEDKKRKFFTWSQDNSLSNDEGNTTLAARPTIDFIVRDPEGKMKTNPFIIQLKYMKSYKEGGMVDVYWDNNLIASLDGLWREYNQFHFTFADMYYEVHQERADSTILDHKLSIVYKGSKKCVSNDEKECAARGDDQKFRLISAKICQMLQ